MTPSSTQRLRHRHLWFLRISLTGSLDPTSKVPFWVLILLHPGVCFSLSASCLDFRSSFSTVWPLGALPPRYPWIQCIPHSNAGSTFPRMTTMKENLRRHRHHFASPNYSGYSTKNRAITTTPPSMNHPPALKYLPIRPTSRIQERKTSRCCNQIREA